jgi:HTH-type transcriptional regulator/antitoxin HipB
MRIRASADLGGLIRDHPIKLAIDQRSLSQKLGVSRQWIVEVEKRKPRAEIGLLLGTIDAPGILLATERESRGKKRDTAPQWILIPSSPPRAEIENDQGTHRDH